MKKVIIDNLSFSYDKEKQILQNINIEIEEGEFVCILGQSGCGKSTLLRLIAGLEKPTQGSITIGDKLVEGASLSRSVVFQDYGLFPWMSAGDNITLAIGQCFPKKNKKELETIAKNMLLEVGLDLDVFDKFPKELSGGMKQRCAIAQAFGMDSSIMLMDEPFGALDAVTRARLQELIIKLCKNEKEKKIIFFVTHDVDEALLLANRIILLGQSPSNIIYDCKLERDYEVSRLNQFEDPNIFKLRNELIDRINRDVAERI